MRRSRECRHGNLPRPRRGQESPSFGQSGPTAPTKADYPDLGSRHIARRVQIREKGLGVRRGLAIVGGRHRRADDRRKIAGEHRLWI